MFGSQAVPSLQNAPFVGAQRVLDTYAKQIYDTIQRDGFYVRVPAGKQFYVYVTQTIDKSRAVIGGTRFSTLASADEPEKENPNDPLHHLRQNLRRIYSPATERQPSGTPRLQTPEALLPKLPTR